MPALPGVSARSGAGVRKPSGKEPAAGGDGVADYGDLAVGGVARAIPASANESTGNRLPRSERGRCGLRRGDLGMMLCIARTIVGDAVTGLRHRKRHPPAGGRSGEVTAVMALRPDAGSG